MGDAPLVMIVDDDDDFRNALEEVLEDHGYRVVAAAHGAEAIDQLRLGVRPDLLLLDLWMPEMDGWQLLHALGTDEALIPIPIVVMTAAEPPGAELLNVREVLPKPFPLFDILGVVERYC